MFDHLNLIKSLLKLAPFMVWTADIKYVFCDGKWRYLHVVRDQLTNIILAWKLQLTRTAQDSIDLFKKAMKKWKIKPKYVHADHRVEYANFAFKTFLEENGIIQSMPAKGKSLENRGSEYFFCNIQQELFNTLKHIKWTCEFINSEISQYIFRYNNIRIQSNLGYCTPIEYMCKLLVNQTFSTFLKSKFISLSIN